MPNRRLTVNLSPASMPKAGSGFDLPHRHRRARRGGAGPGRGRARRWCTSASWAWTARCVRSAGCCRPCWPRPASASTSVVVPADNAAEAALVPGHAGAAGAALSELVGRYRLLGQGRGAAGRAGRGRRRADREPEAVPDLRDVVGQDEARLALEIAAAGGHHLLMVGPPGAGKTMLAERLPGLLPAARARARPGGDGDPLGRRACCPGRGAGLAGRRSSRRTTARRWRRSSAAAAASSAPARSPGPTAACCSSTRRRSSGSRCWRRCASRSSPARSTIARASGVVRYPARFQLVLAANPCPCGRGFGKGADCSCSPTGAPRLHGQAASGRCSTGSTCSSRCTPSAGPRWPSRPARRATVVAARVLRAREVQAERLAGAPGGRSTPRCPAR